MATSFAALNWQARGHAPEVMAMDEAEVNRLCEEMSTLIEIDAALNRAVRCR
jgi:hypothetical protein